MNNRLLSKLKRLGDIYHDWGGITPIVFSYTHASHDIGAGLHVALLPFISIDLGLSYLRAGFLISAYALTAGFSQIIGGWLADRFSKYIVIAIGLAGIGFATFAIGLSSAFYPMLAILVIMGLFAGAYHPSAAVLISDHFEKTVIGKAISVHLVGGSFGHAIGPILGGLIANTIGWRFAYIFLSIPTLLAIPVSLTKFRKLEQSSLSKLTANVPTVSNNTIEEAPKRLNLLQGLRPVADIIILATLIQLVVGSANSFFPMFLVDKYNIAPVYASMLVGVIRGAGIAGSLLGGWISDKWGRVNSIALVFFMVGPSLFLCTILPNNIALIASFAIFGLLLQMRESTAQPYLLEKTPRYLRATIFGIYFGIAMEGRSVLQPVVGHIVDTYGVIDVFQVLAFITIALSLAALLIIKRSKLSG